MSDLDNIEQAIRRLDCQLQAVVRQAAWTENPSSYEPGEIANLWNDLETLSKMRQHAQAQAQAQAQ